jgi:DNA-directed RNA polymerase subunit RPC12/RpoP
MGHIALGSCPHVLMLDCRNSLLRQLGISMVSRSDQTLGSRSLNQLGSAPGSRAAHRGVEPGAAGVMAAYICKRCEIEGQDVEVSPGQVFCWNCGEKAMITARIVIKGA